MKKLIYLEDAVDAVKAMEDKSGKGEIAGFYNMILERAIDKLNDLPSAQPEIIKCKDCRWWDNDGESQSGYCYAIKHGYHDRHWEINIYRRYQADFFCGDAERRTDEETDIS